MEKKMNHLFSFPLAILFTLLLSFAGRKAGGQTISTDYTSKVPQFTFAATLAEQENQLKSNPLILRFIESRKKMENDPFRPIYHFVSPEGNLNDPNGLCFWKGNWHMFYQGYPPEDTRQHWGHAMSNDLIHWKDLPYAIYPNPEYQCFSGATMVEDNRVIAMYHGTRLGNMVATSSDPLLLNWEKVTGQAVIPIKSQTGFPLSYSVFDPCIWKKDSVYYALSGGRLMTGPGGKPVRANFLFRSLDLAHWEYLHEFTENDRFTLIGDDGACPYFWPIGDRYMLNFFSHMSGGQYLLGDYDKQRDKFIITSGGKYNHGAVSPSGVHAPSVTPDGKGGLIIIFNMNPGKQTVGWNQIMSLPRRLTLVSKDEIGIEPAGDIESLRYNDKHFAGMKLPANKEIVLNGVKGNAMEIVAEIDPKNSQTVEMNVLRSPGKEEYTRIVFFKEKGMNKGREAIPGPGVANAYYSYITIESSYSTTLPDVKTRAPETGSFILKANETLKLRIFIDKSIVEVFANGRQCVAMRIYPGRDDSLGVSLRAQGQDAELISLDAWQMKSIF